MGEKSPTSTSKALPRVYHVKPTPSGNVIEGPNRHVWDAKNDDWNRCTAMAKAMERAFLEGQKSLSMEPDLAVVLEMFSRLDIKTLAALDTAGELGDLKDNARVLARRIREVRSLNRLERAQPEP